MRWSLGSLLNRGGLATVTVKGNYNRKGASSRSGDGLATQIGGAPSPRWLEWYQGFPVGWLESEPLEMPASQFKRLWRIWLCENGWIEK